MPTKLSELVKQEKLSWEIYPVEKDKTAAFMRLAHSYGLRANPPRKISTEAYKAISVMSDEVITLVKVVVLDKLGEKKLRKPRAKKVAGQGK